MSRRTTREYIATQSEEYRSERFARKGRILDEIRHKKDIRANMPPICRTARYAFASGKAAERPSSLSGAPRRSRGASNACRKNTTGQKPGAKQKVCLKRIPLAGRLRPRRFATPFGDGRPSPRQSREEAGIRRVQEGKAYTVLGKPATTPPFLTNTLSI